MQYLKQYKSYNKTEKIISSDKFAIMKLQGLENIASL